MTCPILSEWHVAAHLQEAPRWEACHTKNISWVKGRHSSHSRANNPLANTQKEAF